MLGLCITGFLGACFCLLILIWMNSRPKYLNLPPGTLGLPLIGESIMFVKKKIAFFQEKHAQYGRVFKTHLFGNPTIRVYGADNIRHIIRGEGKYVQSSYPSSVNKLLGSQSISMSHGDAHKHRKSYLMKCLGPEFLRCHIPVLSTAISDKLQHWCSQPAIDLYVECRNLFIELAAKYLINIDISEDEVTEIREQLDIMMNNIFSLPINIPGLGFNKALKAKQRLREIIQAALSSSSNRNNNFDEPLSVLEGLYGSVVNDNDLKDNEKIIDPIIELLFSSTETVSSAGFMLCYELMKEAGTLEKVIDDITKCGLLNPSEIACVHDLQTMTYVDAVVKETLRVAPPTGGAYRVATQAFELDGYTIPKGWSIVFSIRDTQHNDESVANPLEFKPDRWLKNDFALEKYAYLPFGAGTRICPGQAYAKTVLKLFAIEFARTCSPNITSDSDLQLWPTPRPSTQVLAEIRTKNCAMLLGRN